MTGSSFRSEDHCPRSLAPGAAEGGRRPTGIPVVASPQAEIFLGRHGTQTSRNIHGYAISPRFEGARPNGPDGEKLQPSAKTTKRRGSFRIKENERRKLKAFFREMVCHRSVERLTDLFQSIPFDPYAPVRQQLLGILRAVNKSRKASGYEEVPVSALKLSWSKSKSRIAA